LQIQIVSSSTEVKPTQKGSYTQLELVYKNLSFQGKIESKKLMSFGANAATFTALKDAPQGTVWEVSVVKNSAGFNDWPTVVAASGTAPAAGGTQAPTGLSTGKAQLGPKSTYETPEERAQRQILIVRQSSLSAACATLSVGAKAVKPADVIAVAKEYEAYVFGIGEVKGPSSDFDDMPDFDVPEVA